MLYIKKQYPDRNVSANISEVKRTRQWDSVDKQDVPRVRSCFNDLDKALIKAQLLKEQHGLCAYCMSRIEKDSKMRIDHFIPIQVSGEDALSYSNMVGCCHGGTLSEVETGARKVLCCDAAKGEQQLAISPYNSDQMKKIRYSRKGRIYTCPKDNDMEYDLNVVLHLNGILDDTNEKTIADTATNLVLNRKLAYEKYVKIVRSLESKQMGTLKTRLEKQIQKIENEETYIPYAGVLLYFLKRKLKAL